MRPFSDVLKFDRLAILAKTEEKDQKVSVVLRPSTTLQKIRVQMMSFNCNIRNWLRRHNTICLFSLTWVALQILLSINPEGGVVRAPFKHSSSLTIQYGWNPIYPTGALPFSHWHPWRRRKSTLSTFFLFEQRGGRTRKSQLYRRSWFAFIRFGVIHILSSRYSASG